MTTLEKLKQYKEKNSGSTLEKLKRYKQGITPKKELPNDGHTRFTPEEIQQLNTMRKPEPKIDTSAFMPKTQPIDIRNKNQNFFTDPQALQRPVTQATMVGLDIANRPANAAVNVLRASNETPEYVKVDGKMYKVRPKAKQDIGTAFIRGITGQDRPEALEITAPKSVIEKAKREQPFLTGVSEFTLATVTDPSTYIGGEALKVVAKKILGKIPLQITQKLAKGTAKVEDIAKAAGKTENEIQRLLDNEAAELTLKGSKEIPKFKQYADGSIVPQSTYEPVRKPIVYADGTIGEKVDIVKKPVYEFKSAKPNDVKSSAEATRLSKVSGDTQPTKQVVNGTQKLPETETELKAAIETLTEQLKTADEATKAKLDLQLLAHQRKLAAIPTKPLPINQAVGDINTARQKISYDHKPQKSGNLWERVRTQFADKYAALERLEKNVRGKIPSAEKSLYKQARLFEGVPERASRIVQAELKPIIKSIEAKGYSYKDLGLYAEAVHAKDVNSAGIVSGFSDSEISDIIQKLGTPEMEAARKQLVEYSNKRLEHLLDNDVISQAAYDAMRDKWENYIPLNRVFDDDKVEFAGALGKAFSNVGNPIKGLKGSQRQIIDPVENLIKNTYKIENAAGRNKVGKQLDRLSMLDTQGQFIRKLNPGEEVGRRNVVNVKTNGENVKYEVDPEVYKAMNQMDKEASNMLFKILAAPASVLRAGATLTVDFALRNPIRDIMNAFKFSKSGFNPFTDFAVGLGSYIKKGKLYDDFLRNNAGYGNIISMDRQAHREAVKRVVKQTPTEKFVNIINPKSWVEVMRTISDATESATKIGEFRAALRKGVTPQEAAYRARDLMDFARSGNVTKNVNRIVAFLNANIQGKSVMIRAIKERPLQVGAKMFITDFLPSVGMYATVYYFANEKQKATIKDAPTWMRDSFWLIPIPGTDIVARIPKSFEGAAISNLTEKFLDYTMENDKEAFDGFIKNTIKEQSIPVMLSGVTPIIEGMSNYSFFRQSPIIPQREKYLLPKDQYDIYTSEISKGLAGIVGKVAPDSNFASPRIIDNTIRGVTAGVGGYVLDATDAVMGKNKPAKNLTQYPAVKAFTVNENATGKAVSFAYDELDKLSRERGSYNDDNPVIKGKPKPKEYPREKQYKFLYNTSKQVSAVSKEIRIIQNNKTMSPQDKRTQINELSQKRNDIARVLQEQYKKGEYIIKK